MGILDTYNTAQEKSEVKCIAVVGEEKGGKTSTLTALANELKGRAFYIDSDYLTGTKPYIGSWSKVTSWDDMGRIMGSIAGNIEQVRKDYDVCIIDTFDCLMDMKSKSLMKKWGVDNLADYKEKGMGNGYTIFYSDIENKLFPVLFSAFKLVILVIHPKLETLQTSDTKSIKYGDLDLVGKLKSMVKRTVDAFFVFEGAIQDGVFRTLVNKERHSDFVFYPLGMRDYSWAKKIHDDATFKEEVKKLITE